MKYTTQETEYLNKRIRRLEKNKKHWLWVRWLMLFASIVNMASAAYNFYGGVRLLYLDIIKQDANTVSPTAGKIMHRSNYQNKGVRSGGHY